MSMSGLFTTAKASVVISRSGPASLRAFSRSRTAAIFTTISRPARRVISSALRRNTVGVPPPTGPKPNRPTLMGFISLSCPSQLLTAVPFAVVFEEARNPADGFGEIVHIGQEHHPEMVGMRPVEAAALHQQDFFLKQQLKDEFLVVGDRVHLRVEPRKKVHRPLRLDAGNPRDFGQQLPGQVALP